MLRVLLVIDDYSELLFLQTLLKKLGFDVDGIQSERSFEETYLTLNPEMLIATAKGKRVNGLSLVENIRRTRGYPKTLLLAPSPLLERLKVLQLPNVDMLVESPVGTMALLRKISQLGEIDEAALVEKYRKLKATLDPQSELDLHILNRDQVETYRGPDESLEENAVTLKGPNGSDEVDTPIVKRATSSMGDEERKRRFAKFVNISDKPQATFFDKDRVQQFTKEIRQSENPEENADLEEERQAFVKALFRKAKG